MPHVSGRANTTGGERARAPREGDAQSRPPTGSRRALPIRHRALWRAGWRPEHRGLLALVRAWFDDVRLQNLLLAENPARLYGFGS